MMETECKWWSHKPRTAGHHQELEWVRGGFPSVPEESGPAKRLILDVQPPELRYKKFLLFHTKLKRHMHPCVHGSIIYNIQNMEAIQMPINRWMDKEAVLIYNGMAQP